jgi:hypothetical protein
VLGLVGMSISSIFKNKKFISQRNNVGFGIVTFLSLLFSGAACNVSGIVQKRFVRYL